MANPETQPIPARKSKDLGLRTIAGLLGLALGPFSASARPEETKKAKITPKPSLEEKDSSLFLETRYSQPLVSGSQGELLSVVLPKKEEEKSVKFNKKILLPLGQPYYLVDNPNIPGDQGVFKKTEVPAVLVDNQVLVSLNLLQDLLEVKVALNEPAKTVEMNKNGKKFTLPTEDNLVPIEKVTQTLGIKTIYDQPTKILLIGWTEKEKEEWFPSLKESLKETPATDILNIEATFKAFEHMAGGEFTSPFSLNFLGPFPFTEAQSGAVVVFSNKDFEEIDKKVTPKKSSLTVAQLHQEYLKQSLIGKISQKLTKDDMVYVLNGEAYIFGKQSFERRPVVFRASPDNQIQQLPYEYQSFFMYVPKIKWYEPLGIVATDDLRITHYYERKTNTWQELDEYIMLGTPEQRIRKTLSKLLAGKIEEKGVIYQNPLGLDEQEVRQYLATGSDKGLQSFQIMKDAQGKPAYVLVTGGKYGFDLAIGNNENHRLAVQRLNEIAPKMIKTIVERFRLSAFAADIAPGGLFNRYIYGATFSVYDFGSVVFFNETPTNAGGGKWPPGSHLGILVVESRGLYGRDHLYPFWNEERQDWDYLLKVKDALGKDDGEDKWQYWKNFEKKYLPPNCQWDGYEPLSKVYPHWKPPKD